MMLWDLGRYGDAVALVEDQKTLTYDELVRQVKSLAGNLTDRSLVFLSCENTVGCIVSYLACLESGAVPLLLDSALDAALFQALCDTYKPAYYLVPESMVEKLAHVTVVCAAHDYVLCVAAQTDAADLHEDLAVLVSTSGSTGTPKLIRLSRQNIRANTASIVEYLHITSEERAITSLPMNYVYGLSVVHTHLSAGATLVLTSLNCYTGGFWKLFDQMECTSFAGVPFMYEMLDKLRFTRSFAHPTLKTMTQAGGHLTPDLQERFGLFAQQNGVDFFVMYGASEATARMSYLPPEYAISKRGSIGIAIPGGRFELADENGRAVQDGESGELVYYGENVSMGYATCRSDLALPDENHGRLVTGDIARCDEDGFYYIVGRKKRFVKILGKRTSLDEVEDLLKPRFPDAAIACGGRDDLLGVFFEGEADAAEISSFLHQKLGVNEKMITVKMLEELPKNSSGKVRYSVLNELV